jgi:hypothetical protein
MSKGLATLTAALTTSVAVQADSDKNVQIMLKAARSTFVTRSAKIVHGGFPRSRLDYHDKCIRI